MPLIVGSRSYDLSTRALVLGVLRVDGAPAAELAHRAEGLVAEGGDLIELAGVGEDVDAISAAVQAVRLAVEVPLAVASRSAAAARAAVNAGAALSASPEVALETRTSLLAPGPDAALAAARTGVGQDRIVVDVTPRLRPQPRDLALGYPLLASTDDDGSRARVLAAAALAVSTGCRLLRTADVRGVARVRNVLAAVLQAGAPAAKVST